ncbi:flagellar assembly protein FliW [Accumulibacter sp.]|nr:flagellar assembly protein FliW [Accumulibacter sp.]HRF03324.1 flagellar assembly protein FliW [Accumulibacter sp.]
MASVIGCAGLAEKTRTMQNQAAELKAGDTATAALRADRIAAAWRMELNCDSWLLAAAAAQGNLMKIDIERFGLKDVAVDPDTVFTFAEGLAGFPDCRQFKVFHEEGKATVFWLQSLDDADLSFPIVPPQSLDLEYQIELSDADCALLGLENADDASVALIVYRNAAEGGKIAANTRSPIILNTSNRRGMQKVLQDVHPTLLYRAR